MNNTISSTKYRPVEKIKNWKQYQNSANIFQGNGWWNDKNESELRRDIRKQVQYWQNNIWYWTLCCFPVFNLLDFKKGVNGKWRVATFMKSCDFYEMLRLWWKVVTFMKSCNFYEKLWLLWKVVTFMKGDDHSERLWLFR